jgi:hypothetical protein
MTKEEIITDFVKELMEKNIELNSLIMDEYYETAALLNEDIKNLIQITSILLDLDNQNIGYENIHKTLEEQYQGLYQKMINKSINK